MRLETILNAHEEALLFGYEAQGNPERQVYERRIRQASAFRARILRMDAGMQYENNRRLENLSAIKTAFDRARFYWYGLQLDAKQAELFQKGIDVLSREIMRSIESENKDTPIIPG